MATYQELLDSYIKGIKTVSSQNSQASSRVIVNDSMNNIKEALKLISGLNILNLGGLIFPSPLYVGTPYNLTYNGSGFTLTIANNPFGIKNYIRPSDSVTVNQDYQYIVHNSFTNDGTFILDGGELVILS